MDQPTNAGLPETGKGNGPVVGIIVVIIVLAIGAYYLYAELQSQKAARETAPQQESTEVTDMESDITAETDDLDTLEAELDADLQELDAELQAQ